MKIIRPINISFILLISFCVVLLSSCVYNQQYTYDIRLERPVQSKNLLFENDTMSISFVFGTADIELDLYNKLDDAIKINGRDLSASVNGNMKAILSSAYQRPAMIAPRSKTKIYLQIYDGAGHVDSSGTPTGKLNTYPAKDNNWEPYRQYILGLKGRKTTIYLPYYVKDVYCSKTFEFVVADVIAIPPPQKNGPAK